MTNLQLINAILYVAENGCKWRELPQTYGNWHAICIRMNRWSKNGVLDRVFAALQVEGIIRIDVSVVRLDSTSVKVHPDGTGALKKRGKQAIVRSRVGLTTKIHIVTASDRSAVSFSLSSGEKHDSPERMKLLNFTPIGENKQFILMDRAYEGDKMRSTVDSLGYEPVVPPKKNRIDPWEYDGVLYKRRNESERFF